jgi:hypothetical protein
VAEALVRALVALGGLVGWLLHGDSEEYQVGYDRGYRNGFHDAKERCET